MGILLFERDWGRGLAIQRRGEILGNRSNKVGKHWAEKIFHISGNESFLFPSNNIPSRLRTKLSKESSRFMVHGLGTLILSV